jgi:hypothetical protein
LSLRAAPSWTVVVAAVADFRASSDAVEILARKALRDTDEPQLVDTQATAEPELIGPFQVPIPLTLSVTDGHTLVGTDGSKIDETVQPGTKLDLRPAPGTHTDTIEEVS